MCYSAQVYAEIKKFTRLTGVKIKPKEYVRLYWDRKKGSPYKFPKAMDASLSAMEGPEGAEIRQLVEEYNRDQIAAKQQELADQVERLEAAEEKMAKKPTKGAANELRIAGNKIDNLRKQLNNIRRVELVPEDSRIFPAWFCPVLVMEDGELTLRVMRYLCRPYWMSATSDKKRGGQMSGKYNARRDNIDDFWEPLFGVNHAIMVADLFYENVEATDKMPARKIKYTPSDGSTMFVACLWSEWTDPTGELPDLTSFAAVTDEPEPEVAATGHNRTIINLPWEEALKWLTPARRTKAELQQIMDRKQHPFYLNELDRAA